MTRVEVKRAALIAGASLGTPKALRDWIRKAVKVLPSRLVGAQVLEAWAKVTCPKACRREDRGFHCRLGAATPRFLRLRNAEKSRRRQGYRHRVAIQHDGSRHGYTDSELRHAFELW